MLPTVIEKSLCVVLGRKLEWLTVASQLVIAAKLGVRERKTEIRKEKIRAPIKIGRAVRIMIVLN